MKNDDSMVDLVVKACFIPIMALLMMIVGKVVYDNLPIVVILGLGTMVLSGGLYIFFTLIGMSLKWVYRRALRYFNE